ncbi:MAG: 4-alpha-glucanotransferase [Thermoguttaceae bacterium]|nr:4-alpha-glucanotransferase [Thermoguttaceae bacterium]
MSVRRSSGALAPLFSLPGVRDVGSLGRCARRFVDFLADSGQRWWQSLPVNPIDAYGSPYAGRSAFAGETLYLDLEDLRDEGLLDDADLAAAWFLPDAASPNCANLPNPAFPPSSTPQTDARSERIDYRAAFERRRPCWRKAFERYRDGGGAKYRALEKRFRYENEFWLDDFALFAALSEEFGHSWQTWPAEFRRRDTAALAEFAEKRADELDYLRFLQLVFDVQWNELRSYCAERNVGLFGDVPIYVGKNSADVWAFRDLFQVDLEGRTIREAGVPADDFNPDGQRWSSPLYRWERHRETDFDWWRRRMKKTLSRFDLIRLDHFIGFYNFYSFPGDGVPETAATSASEGLDNQTKKQNRDKPSNIVKKLIIFLFGKSSENQPRSKNLIKKQHIVNGVAYEDGWEPGPQEAFFDAIFADCPREAFVAEDLGVMNAGVCALRDRYRLPGMQVFQFSFDDVKIDAKTNTAPNPLENWSENYIAYTGTHDAAPILGWLADVEKYGGGAWPTLDFAGIVDVLERYRRDDDRPAAILDGDAPSEESSDSTQTADSAAPTLGVSLRCEPLSEQIANLRTAALRAVAKSPCRLAIFPIQDVLGLSNDARVNFPGVGVGNWTWRFADDALTPETCRELRKLTEESGRI